MVFAISLLDFYDTSLVFIGTGGSSFVRLGLLSMVSYADGAGVLLIYLDSLML